MTQTCLSKSGESACVFPTRSSIAEGIKSLYETGSMNAQHQASVDWVMSLTPQVG